MKLSYEDKSPINELRTKSGASWNRMAVLEHFQEKNVVLFWLKEEKTEIVPELSLEFHFDILLKIIKRTHSTYCYQLKELDTINDQNWNTSYLYRT